MSLFPDDCDGFYANEFDNYGENDLYDDQEADRPISDWLGDMYDEELAWEREQVEIIPGVTLDGREIARDDF